MKKSQILIIVALVVLLLALNWMTRDDFAGKEYFGGLPWYGWAGISLFLMVIGAAFAIRDAARARKLLEEPPPAHADEADQRIYLSKELLEKYDPDGPNYPHPVIVAERCIGCHACVDACPHDVLAIVNGISTPIARDQCMEDTSCQVECPVNPKACIVVNTTKKIMPRKVPRRDASFMTDVPGVYLIGDVSGTPLIKNAANEGAAVAIHIAHELHAANGNGGPPQANYDVAIIGAGPAGLSAAVMAKRLGLRYIGIEQDTVMSTIVKYPKGKYVFLKPETMEWNGGIRLPGLEEYVEEVIEEMMDEPQRAQAAALLAAERAGTIADAGRQLLAAARDRYQAYLEIEAGFESPFPDAKKFAEWQMDVSALNERAARAKAPNATDAERSDALAALLERARLFRAAGKPGLYTFAMWDYARALKLDPTNAEAQEALNEGKRRLASAREKFEALLDREDKAALSELLQKEREKTIDPTEVGTLDRLRKAAMKRYGERMEAEVESGKLPAERYEALKDARHKVAGDQREVLLNTWFKNMAENNVEINENESCKAVKKAADGDYFNIETVKAGEKATYAARSVILAIGTAGTPMKLKVKGETLKVKLPDGTEEERQVQVTRDGKTEDKVKYKLNDPEAYKGKKIIVVGAGNSAIEGAVDLVARRSGDQIEFRPPEETNEVTLLVRSDLKNDLKFGNKMQLYDCIDEGKIKVYFRAAIYEIRDDEVVIMKPPKRDAPKDAPPEVITTLKNDYVFAMIGGDKPTKFLTDIGISIG